MHFHFPSVYLPGVRVPVRTIFCVYISEFWGWGKLGVNGPGNGHYGGSDEIIKDAWENGHVSIIPTSLIMSAH